MLGSRFRSFQFWVHDGGLPRFRIDLAYPLLKIAIEYDGLEFHEGDERKKVDEERRDWLRDDGWLVIVVRKSDFKRATRERWLAEIRDALRDRTPARSRRYSRGESLAPTAGSRGRRAPARGATSCQLAGPQLPARGATTASSRGHERQLVGPQLPAARTGLGGGRGASLGDGVEGHGCGNTGVEGLQGTRHRDRDELVAGLRHQPGQALAFGADDDHQGSVGQVEVGQRHFAVGGQADHHAAGVLVRLQLPDQVDRLGDGDPRGGTGRGLPCRRGHTRGPTLRDEYAVRAETGRGADHRAEVARIGHLVERHDQGRFTGLRCRVDEVVRVR